jgi:RND family efflux transporter MFP subunit
VASSGSSVLAGKRVSVVSRIVVSVVILGVSLGIFRTLVALKPPAPRQDRPPAAMTVRVITATPVRTPRAWRGYGTAVAKAAADVAAEVAGTVVTRAPTVEVGGWIDAGEALVTIDAREYADRARRSAEIAASLEADLAGLDVELESQQETLRLADQSADLTRRELDRIRGAVEAGSANRFELEAIEDRLARVLREREVIQRELSLIPTRKARVRAQLDAERASQRLAELDVERCAVRSPISGVLQEIDVEVGERVNVGSRVGRVVDLGVIEVPVRVPVAGASWVRVGAKVAVAGVSEGREGAWEGVVARIAPEADPATRTIGVYVEVDQRGRDRTGPTLLPGQFVFGRIESAETIERIAVPRGAVSGDRVFVVDAEGVVATREVEIAFASEGRHPGVHPDETQWYILEGGVEPGEVIAVSNIADLRPGMRVTAADVGRAVAGEPAR